ncbi:Fe-S cluster assembly protein SufD [Crocinitomix catalasitica]|nr:Fe-S cluster assembly protein SufD [Crocinitomix catalasitica]
MDVASVSEKVEKFLDSLDRPEGIQAQWYDQLLALDFPTTRDEYWKYTRLGKIANSKFKILPTGRQVPTIKSQISKTEVEKWVVSDNCLVIENGIIRDDLSKTGDSQIGLFNADSMNRFSDKVRTNKLDIFNVLNDVYFSQGILIKESSEEPLQLIFIETGGGNLINNRIQIRLPKSSKVKIIQAFVSVDGGDNFINTVAQYHVEENAQLEIDILQNFKDSTCSMSTTEVYQEQNSKFKINTAIVSGLLVRNNINIAVNGQNCETFMNGAVIGKDKMHVDNHTFVDHKVPHCESNENYKYVLDDQSTGVFNGKVIVRPDAQVINAYQSNANILLSGTAAINSKPELEIYADDVKCSHGSTTGQLDEEALFYLQTRGISKEAARQMLVSAFIKEVIEEIDNPKMVELVERAIQEEHGWSF